MDLTDAQKQRIAELKAVFGSNVIKEHARSRTTGHVRVTATALAGEWQWTFDADGKLRAASLDQTLTFEYGDA